MVRPNGGGYRVNPVSMLRLRCNDGNGLDPALVMDVTARSIVRSAWSNVYRCEATSFLMYLLYFLFTTM